MAKELSWRDEADAEARKYRTFWRRFWAMFIDCSPAYPLVYLDKWLFANPPGVIVLVAWFLVFSLGFSAYTVGMHAHSGQTIGKRITGVAVRDVSGEKLTLRQALLRDAVPIGFTVLAVVRGMPRVLERRPPFRDLGADESGSWEAWANLTWLALELVTMLTNRKRRALHDFIAGSIVIRVR